MQRLTIGKKLEEKKVSLRRKREEVKKRYTYESDRPIGSERDNKDR